VYNISDSIYKWLMDEFHSKVIMLEYVSPINVLLGEAHAVLKGVPGGGGGSRT
jgi:hypothetical protein